jgi:hypothetical protein
MNENLLYQRVFQWMTAASELDLASHFLLVRRLGAEKLRLHRLGVLFLNMLELFPFFFRNLQMSGEIDDSTYQATESG